MNELQQATTYDIKLMVVRRVWVAMETSNTPEAETNLRELADMDLPLAGDVQRDILNEYGIELNMR